MDKIAEVKINEVMVVSGAGNKNNDITIFDINSGNVIYAFKDGRSMSKGLSFVGKDFIMAALKDKTSLKCWTLSKTHNESKHIICPGKVSCLAVTPAGDFCVAGIEKNLYVWEVVSGALLKILANHSQAVTCVRFTSDGTYLLSGGRDGLVFVYILTELIDAVESRDKPYFTWMAHNKEVTDIFAGKLGYFARVATASNDMTCKIYDLATGKVQLTIRADFRISAITMDNAEYFMFLGSYEGNICRVNLFTSRDGDVLNCSSGSRNVYAGHRGSITALSSSSLGQFLLSGSEDGEAKLWNINNFCCIKKMKYDGPVTNAFIALTPPGLKPNPSYYPDLRIGTFSRYEEQNSESSIYERVSEANVYLTHVETPDQYFDDSILHNPSLKSTKNQKFKTSVQELETINQQLYAYALADLEKYDNSHSDSE